MNRVRRSAEDATSVAVYGLGNVLLGDDGGGHPVIAELNAQYLSSEDVVIEDLGTPGLDLVPYIICSSSGGLRRRAAGSEPAGSVHVFSREQILRQPPAERLSPHEPRLKESLQRVELAREAVLDVVWVGVAIESIEYRAGLSQAVASALPRALQAMIGELRARGVDPTRRLDGPVAARWWAST